MPLVAVQTCRFLLRLISLSGILFIGASAFGVYADVTAGSSISADDCARLLSNSSVQSWARSFDNLKTNIQLATQSLGQQPASNVLYVNLSNREREAFVSSIRSTLDKAVKNVGPKIKGDSNAQLREEIGDQRRDLTKLLKAKEETTYAKILSQTRLTLKIVDKLDRIERGENLSVTTHSGSQYDTSNQRFTQIIVGQGIIPIITDREFSIRDFNQLLGTPFLPLGLISRAVHVDGFFMNPTLFFDHDIEHATLYGANSLFFDSSFPWQQLLAKIALWEDRDEAAAHALIFFLSHEYGQPFSGRFALDHSDRPAPNRLDIYGIKRLWSRLQNESFWQEQKLASISNPEQFLGEIANRLDRELAHLRNQRE